MLPKLAGSSAKPFEAHTLMRTTFLTRDNSCYLIDGDGVRGEGERSARNRAVHGPPPTMSIVRTHRTKLQTRSSPGQYNVQESIEYTTANENGIPNEASTKQTRRIPHRTGSHLCGHLVFYHLVLHDPRRLAVCEAPQLHRLGRPGCGRRESGSMACLEKRCGGRGEGWLGGRRKGDLGGRSRSRFRSRGKGGLGSRSRSRFSSWSRSGFRGRSRGRSRRGVRPLVDADGVDAAAGCRGVAGAQGLVGQAAQAAGHRTLELVRSSAEALSSVCQN